MGNSTVTWEVVFVLNGKDLRNNNDALLNVHVELEKTYLNFSKASGLMAAPSMISRMAFSKCMICQVESEHHKRRFCDPIDDRTSIAIRRYPCHDYIVSRSPR